MIVDDTVKTLEFWKFLLVLKYVLFQSKALSKFNVWITLDNAPVHTSYKSMEILKWLKIEAYFLPPHSPELAPVELFFRWIKKKILSKYNKDLINFDKIEGRKTIFYISKDWGIHLILNLWNEFIKNSKRLILNLYKTEKINIQ